MNPSGSIRYFNRRVDENGNPISWTDEQGKEHQYVYDLECSEDGHDLGTAVITSWVGVRALDPRKGTVKVSIWHGYAGRPAETTNVDAVNIGSGFAVRGTGLCAVVSMSDVPLVCWNERNVLPKP